MSEVILFQDVINSIKQNGTDCDTDEDNNDHLLAVHMGMWGFQLAIVVSGSWSLIVVARTNGMDSLENGAMRGK